MSSEPLIIYKSKLFTYGLNIKGGFYMNFASFIICIVLALIVTAIIVSLVKNKKNGKSSCGCNCGCCGMSEACHTKKNIKSKPI